jgi:hypothetical protein
VKDAQGSVSTTTNMSSNAQEMTIHAGAIGKLMSMFSNQYSDGPLAVVREYFCNGDDARISVGSDRPTEVFLPTDLNPEILVRDYGPGLDRDGLTTVFSTYGLSTKDQSNDETGGFGIGSKAAFTIGQQFTVTGFKDGVKTVVLFALNDRGIGEHDVRFEGPTDEPNGVLVSVGVPDVAAMRRAAERFFLTVPKGRALVDGQPPKHLSDVHEFVTFNDEVMLVKDGNGEIRLQMGPVTYRVSKSILQAVSTRLEGLDSQRVAQSLINWEQTDSVLMEVPMGAVNIAPSREDLRDTDATVNRIAGIVQGIHDFIVTDVQAQIDAEPTMWRAMGVLVKALEDLKGFKVSRKAFTFGGSDATFKKEVKVEAPTIFMASSWSGRSFKNRVAVDSSHTIDASRMERTVVVAGVLAADVSKVKRYAKRFIEDSQYDWIVVTEEFSGEVEWFQWGIEGGVDTMTLDEYRAALREMRDSNPAVRNEPSYTTGWNERASREMYDRDVLTDILSWGKDIVVFHERSYGVASEVIEVIGDMYTPVVLLPQQSEAALRKRVEADGSVKIVEHDWLVEAEKQIASKVRAEIEPPTDDERLALGAAEWIEGNQRRIWDSAKRENRYEIRNWRSDLIAQAGGLPTPFAHPLFDNPREDEEMARLIAADLTEERKSDLQRLQRWCGVEFEAIEFEAPEYDMEVEFPLLEQFSSHSFRNNGVYRRDVIAYINSKA